jgi:hypothetical protein
MAGRTLGPVIVAVAISPMLPPSAITKGCEDVIHAEGVRWAAVRSGHGPD